MERTFNMIHLQSREFYTASGKHKTLSQCCFKADSAEHFMQGITKSHWDLLILFMVSEQGNKPSFTLDF
jgi:hypothetical protein